MIDKHPPKHRPCSRCHAGLMSLKYQTYFTWIKGVMLTVPDFPVWVCSMCGYEEYDARAAAWLKHVLERHDRQTYVGQGINPQFQFYSPTPNSFFTIN